MYRLIENKSSKDNLQIPLDEINEDLQEDVLSGL